MNNRDLKRLRIPGTAYGREIFRNVASITRSKSRSLGERKLFVTKTNRDFYTVSQLDRDYYEVDGPHIKQMRVKGWIDALNLINGL